jgi:hypothetical protein
MTTINKRLTDKIQENVAYKNQAKLDRDKIKELNDIIGVLKNENGELSLELKKWVKQQQNGYCWWIKNTDGYILDMGTVPAYSQFTYTQNKPKEIGTAKYRARPFYIEENKTTKIDTQKYKIYASI